ncbi:hypothetical protein C1646_691896, partial [Rhizophagus diaphanus]
MRVYEVNDLCIFIAFVTNLELVYQIPNQLIQNQQHIHQMILIYCTCFFMVICFHFSCYL